MLLVCFGGVLVWGTRGNQGGGVVGEPGGYEKKTKEILMSGARGNQGGRVTLPGY